VKAPLGRLYSLLPDRLRHGRDFPRYRAEAGLQSADDIARLADVLDRAGRELVHVVLERVSPLAVPVMVMIGREAVPQGALDEDLLLEAEGLAAAAMRADPAGEEESEEGGSEE